MRESAAAWDHGDEVAVVEEDVARCGTRRCCWGSDRMADRCTLHQRSRGNLLISDDLARPSRELYLRSVARSDTVEFWVDGSFTSAFFSGGSHS